MPAVDVRRFTVFLGNVFHTSAEYRDIAMPENELEGFVDWKGRTVHKKSHGGTRSTLYVYLMEGFDNIAFLAAAVNLVNYFTLIMHLEIAVAATTLTNFMGTAFLLALLGGFISDSYLNRFKTCVIFASLELLGYLVLTAQANKKSLQPPPCNLFDPSAVCEKVSGGNDAMMFIGLYLVALGNGAVKAALPALGADQFDETDPKERRKISTFFNYFLLSLSIGACIGVTVVVWLMNNKGWDVGFGICAAAVFLGILNLTGGISTYRINILGGSPLTRIAQVFVAALHNRKLKLPENSGDLYQPYDKEAAIHSNLLHTNQFKFLDKAAILTNNLMESDKKYLVSPWHLCSVTQVEEIKILLRMIPVFASTIVMNTCLAQLQTFSVSQGFTMDTSMGKHFDIPPGSLTIIPLVIMVIIIPFYDRVFVPLARRFTGHETGITHLQRVGVGLVLSAISMSIAALVEVKRKNVAIDHGMVDNIPLVMPPIPISVFWLGFQYFVFGIADLFTFVGLMEFFYSEAPAGMRSLATAFSWTSLALGYFFSSVLVKIVNRATHVTKTHGWLGGNNLNRNQLNLFYWLLAILSMLNFFNYLYWSKWYKYKPKVRDQVVDEASTTHLAEFSTS
ncbi:protein NRT1/ PTR FAMILY 4.6-like [Cryptomeria japonica]|uniref:protein NRT1/ PTR FAMILY 4.6-like n=1 Tax=Cryptomeria japonica TaxID=3369 RepID=UPI0027DA99F0|nr:protein NRT1/ PTR FAMILY 4.6-like [Cryptomeria japonica]